MTVRIWTVSISLSINNHQCIQKDITMQNLSMQQYTKKINNTHNENKYNLILHMLLILVGMQNIQGGMGVKRERKLKHTEKSDVEQCNQKFGARIFLKAFEWDLWVWHHQEFYFKSSQRTRLLQRFIYIFSLFVSVSFTVKQYLSHIFSPFSPCCYQDENRYHEDIFGVTLRTYEVTNRLRSESIAYIEESKKDSDE